MIIYDSKNGKYASLILNKDGIRLNPNSGKNFPYFTYDKIDKFEITVYTGEYRTKNGKSIRIERMQIGIKPRGADVIILNSSCSWKMLYELIDYKSLFLDFAVRVSGPSEGVDIPIKIYSQFGEKLLLKDSNTIQIVLFMSTIFLALSGYDIYQIFFNNWYESIDIPATITFFVLGFLGISLVAYNEYVKFKIRRMIR